MLLPYQFVSFPLVQNLPGTPWAYSGVARESDELMAAFPLSQIGEFGRAVATKLSQFCTHAFDNAHEWHFKVCLDEAECFSGSQQRAINTAVRLAQSPVSYAVSYVRLADVTSTLIKDISLQDADRAIIPLDEMKDSQFESFAEGVASVRIQRAAPGSAPFRTQEACGPLDINELIQSILTTSANPSARLLLRIAASLEKTPYFTENWDRTGTAPPIYQAYIIDRLQLTPPAPNSEPWEKRKQHSAEIRKRMVAAYLCLCKELKTQVKYASAEMVLQMSDKCIRDYLSQLDSLYQSSGCSVREFGRHRIPPDVQSGALLLASNRKKETIPVSEVGSPIETIRLIDSLGELTLHLQTSTKGMKSLRSPERGVFVIAFDDPASKLTDTIRLITQAADAGFLKLIVNDDQTMRFRLHCSLAAAFGVSYRGAYYDSLVKQTELIPFYKEPNPEARAKMVSTLGDLLLGSEASLPLFDGAE
jgi:hypothetical protein